MNILQKLISKKKEVQVQKSKINYSEIRLDLSTVLNEYVDNRFDKWYEQSRCPLNAGDVVILDKYNILKGNNGWDSGAGGHDLKGLYPFDLEITEVFADKSLASEKVYMFLDSIPYDLYLNEDGSVKKVMLIDAYERYIKAKNFYGLKTDNFYGFYLSAKSKVLDPNIKIQSWSLNINSFIKAGTDAYDKTKFLWQFETELYFKDKELREVRRDFDAQREAFYQELNRQIETV
jgi:hypothetical protein